MAKRKAGHNFNTLTSQVPNLISYTVLVLVFIFSIMLVRKVTGVEIPPLDFYLNY